MAAQACTRKITADMKARISKAQGVKLNWNNSCSSKLLNTIIAHSEAVRAPKEYIFFNCSLFQVLLWVYMHE